MSSPGATDAAGPVVSPQVAFIRWHYLVAECASGAWKLSGPTLPNRAHQHVELTGNEPLPDVLAKIGEDGWELVAVVPADVAGTTISYYFKRPAQFGDEHQGGTPTADDPSQWMYNAQRFPRWPGLITNKYS